MRERLIVFSPEASWLWEIWACAWVILDILGILNLYFGLADKCYGVVPYDIYACKKGLYNSELACGNIPVVWHGCRLCAIPPISSSYEAIGLVKELELSPSSKGLTKRRDWCMAGDSSSMGVKGKVLFALASWKVFRCLLPALMRSSLEAVGLLWRLGSSTGETFYDVAPEGAIGVKIL